MKITASNNNGLSIFKHKTKTNSSNDFKCLEPTIFNKYVAIKTVESNFKDINSIVELKQQQQERVLKEIHDYRVSKLENIEQDIEHILTLVEDADFTNIKHIVRNVYEMNTDYSEVEKVIERIESGKEFCINENKIELITNENGIKKILAEDFFVKMKLLISKAETLKAIKFLDVFMSDLPGKNILSKNEIASLSQQIYNKTQQLTESLIKKTVDYENQGDKLLSEIHEFTVICDQKKISLSTRQRKQLVDLSVRCFDKYATITPNQENYSNIEDQLEGLRKLKEKIVYPIIDRLSDSKNKSKNKNQVADKLEQTAAYVQSIINTCKDRADILSKIALDAGLDFQKSLVIINKIEGIHNKLQQEKKEFSIQLQPNQQTSRVKKILYKLKHYNANVNAKKKIEKLRKNYNDAVQELYTQCESFVKLNERHVEIKQYLIDHLEKFSSITPEEDKNNAMQASERSIIGSLEAEIIVTANLYDTDFSNVVNNKIIDLTTQQNKLVALIIINYALRDSEGDLTVFEQKIDNILEIIDFKKIQDKFFIDDKSTELQPVINTYPSTIEEDTAYQLHSSNVDNSNPRLKIDDYDTSISGNITFLPGKTVKATEDNIISDDKNNIDNKNLTSFFTTKSSEDKNHIEDKTTQEVPVITVADANRNKETLLKPINIPEKREEKVVNRESTPKDTKN